MARRVVITGSLGYLGSRLLPWLRSRGLACAGFDLGLFADSRLLPSDDAATRLIDARDLTADDLAGAEALVHLAGISNDPFGALKPEVIYDPTREYARRLAELCKRLGIRFIFASSCSVYGIGAEALVTEDSPTHPQTPYSLNKLQIEQDLRELAEGAFQPILLRFATVYGLSPRIRFDVVVNMLAGMAVARRRVVLNSNGMAWRPHVHIEDVCEAVHRAITMPTPPAPLVLNIGATADNALIIDVARMVHRAVPGCALEFLGRDGAARGELVADRKIQDGVDTRTYRVSFERAAAVWPGWRCRWSLAAGIEDLARSLQTLGLSEAQFTDRRFYRLQRLEDHFAAGRVTPQVRWRRDAAHAVRQEVPA
jgi:nucleoside-diphosphate-sugar epimerase